MGGAGTTFIPDLNTKHFKVSAAIKTKFPFTNYCIWDSAFIKEFSQHIPKNNFMLVDIERGSEESVYQLLREQYKEVFLMPTKELLENYLSDLKRPIVIRTCVSEAPYKEIEAAWLTIFPEFVDSNNTRKLQISPKDINIQYYPQTAIITFHLGDGVNSLSRRTLVMVKKKSDWKIAHLHASSISKSKD